jgi:putative copper resistance protein D
MSIDGVLVFQIGAIALENLFLAVVVGTLMCEGWISNDQSLWGRPIRSRMSGIVWMGVFGTLVASLPVLWAATATMSDSTLAATAPMLWPVLTGTHIGYMWQLGTAMLLAFVVVRRFGRTSETLIPRAAMWVSLAVFIFSRSDASHAAAAGDFTLAIAIDFLHLFLISVWIGIVLVAAWVVLPAGTQRLAQDIPSQHAFIIALSRTATYVLIGIVMTGIYNAWRGLGSVANLTTTAYGEVLVVKLLLVTMAIGLGGVNRFWTLPDIVDDPSLKQGRDASSALRRFTRILMIESFVLVLAVIAAAILSSITPAVIA